MFTGIIEEVGAVARRSGHELAILAEVVTEDLRVGDSVAIDGACMTAVAVEKDRFVVQVSPESFKRTTLGAFRPGHAVNLERAMSANGRFGGHVVQGHVDGVGRIESVTPQGNFALWKFWAPDDVARYLVPKGSVCIDGISLTVVEPEGNTFSVAVIPETLTKTKLPAKGKGSEVNMEADIFGKHIYHYLKGGEQNGISRDFLAQHGF
jgi:riboflavin synthase